MSPFTPSLQGQGMGSLGKLPLPTPAPPYPPHISVSDLHDHQPDVPVLCLIQLMHQLPIITLWETWVRADFKHVLPPMHPDWVSPTTWGCLAALVTASPRSEKYLWEIEGCGVGEGESPGLYPSQRQSVHACALGQTLTWRFEYGILPAWCEGQSSAQTPSPGERMQGGKVENSMD